MINAADIRKRVNDQPFKPFRIVMSSGQAHEIFHPEFLMIGKRLLGVGVPADPGDPEFDGLHVVSVLHVTALETLAAGSESSK